MMLIVFLHNRVMIHHEFLPQSQRIKKKFNIYTFKKPKTDFKRTFLIIPRKFVITRKEVEKILTVAFRSETIIEP